jgi:hypothetical protein
VAGKDKTWYFVTCECGKRSYMSKSVAKRAAKHVDRTMRTYCCPISGLWHVGHIPDAVRRGFLRRDEIYRKTDNQEET